MMVMITSVQVMMRRNGTISCAEFALMLHAGHRFYFRFIDIYNFCQVCASCSYHDSKIDF